MNAPEIISITICVCCLIAVFALIRSVLKTIDDQEDFM